MASPETNDVPTGERPEGMKFIRKYAVAILLAAALLFGFGYIVYRFFAVY